MSDSRRITIFWLLLALLWFLPLNSPHLFDPDEGRYAEIPREMVASGDWVTPRLDAIKYFEKPALQYWTTAIAFEVFGEHPWTVRLWPALSGFLGLLLTWALARRLYDTRTALLAVMVQASALLYIAMARIATLDMSLCFSLQLAMTALALLVRLSTASSWRLPALLGVGIVNTFIGRDPARSVPANWPLLEETWPAIVQHAEAKRITIGIENCPMLFSLDEWPGGKNIATSPALWRKLFDFLPSANLGLNFDPSHLVWQHIDYVRCIREFGKRIVHFHAKDTRLDVEGMYNHGILGFAWHTPKLPGLGDVNWGSLFSALTDAGYDGAVCVEVEDRAYEGSLAGRQRALRQSLRFLRQFVT